MYQCLVLLDPDTQITTEQLALELRRFYAGNSRAPLEIAVSAQNVILRWPEYTLKVATSSLPYVLEESSDLADKCGATHPAQGRIARCHTRFEIVGDDDPDIDYFNDYLFVGETLRRLGVVYRFDQASTEFLE